MGATALPFLFIILINNFLSLTAAIHCLFLLSLRIRYHNQLNYTHRAIFMTEEVAALLKGKYGTVDALEDQLIATARRPLYERAYANYYANPGSAIDPDKVSS